MLPFASLRVPIILIPQASPFFLFPPTPDRHCILESVNSHACTRLSKKTLHGKSGVTTNPICHFSCSPHKDFCRSQTMGVRRAEFRSQGGTGGKGSEGCEVHGRAYPPEQTPRSGSLQGSGSSKEKRRNEGRREEPIFIPLYTLLFCVPGRKSLSHGASWRGAKGENKREAFTHSPRT